MKKLLLLFFLILTPGLFAVAPAGLIRDIQEDSGIITVTGPRVRQMTMGKTLYVFRAKKQVGEIKTIRNPDFSRVTAKAVKGDQFRRGDLVYLNRSEGISEPEERKEHVIDVSRVLTRGRVWFALLQYPAPATATTRRLELSHTVGLRVAGSDFFQPIEVTEIDSLVYRHEKGKLWGEAIRLKNGKTLNGVELLAPDINQRFQIPEELASQTFSFEIKLIKPAQELETSPDAVLLKINADLSDTLSLLKIYSNGMFLTEFILSSGSSFEQEIRGIELSSGINRIELVLQPASRQGNDVLPAGPTVKLGEKTIEYSQFNYRPAILVNRSETGQFTVK